jgi:hypothetical protein
VLGPVNISKDPALLLFALMISELFCQAASPIPFRFSNKSLKEVGKTIGVGVGVGVGEGVGVAAGVGLTSTGGVVVATGVGAFFLIGTPLLHTNFLPDFTQVYFNPFTVEEVPTFLHASPCLTAALTGTGINKEQINKNRTGTTLIRIPKGKPAV